MVVFFFPVDRDLIIRLAAEGGCGKIVADDGGTVFDPVPFTALEPSARPTSPRRRVESSVRTGGRSRICGLASTFFSRACHKQKIGPKKKNASTPCASSFRTEEEEETRKKQKKKQKETKSDERKEREERKEKESSTTSTRTTTNTSTATHSTRVCGVLSPRTRRVCDCFGCEAICEKVRSVAAGGLHVCEMHKRKDAFLLKGRGEDMKFRWCFYCHRPQKIEEFSPSSRSICKEKFALRKQRRKVKSELANKNKHLKEATAPTSFVYDDCSTVDPMSFVMDECLNYDDDCLK